MASAPHPSILKKLTERSMRLQEYLAVFSMGLTGHVHDHGVALPAAGFPAGLATTSFSFC